MVNIFLRIFPQFWALEAEAKALREDHAQLTTEKLLLQDRLDASLQDRSRLWTLMEKSIEEMKIAYQMHVNAQWQKQGAGIPYPDAPHLPASTTRQKDGAEPAGRKRIVPSEAVAQRTNEFIRQLVNP